MDRWVKGSDKFCWTSKNENLFSQQVLHLDPLASDTVVPKNPGDVAHDLRVVAEPLRHVGQHRVALQRGEGLTTALAVQGVPLK